MTILSPFMMFVPLLLVVFWGMGEMLFVNKSANKVPFRGSPWAIWGLRVLGMCILIYQLMTTELFF